jgi:tetratricopeptide (TPR) repeat protein
MSKKQNQKQGAERKKCPGCGTRVDTTDKFCRQCGVPLTAGTKANGGMRGLIGLRGFGLAVLALAVFYVVLQYGGGRSAEPDRAPAQRISISEIGSGSPAASANPRLAADQLFNQALTAYESGDSAAARQFIPMALSAYRGLAGLDLDGRYHVALLELAASQPRAALAQADTMLAQVPNHLFGLLVAASAHDQLGQPDRAADYYQLFLDAYTPDVAASRQEYLDHGRVLPARQQAAIEYLRAQGRVP